jgi:SpoVK/Ycf46/Vps4 family AAA+-type ATPase
MTNGFTGAEISALVPEALYAAFSEDERDITTADLVAAASTVVPLSTTASETLDGLRAWAKGRARLASTPEQTKASAQGRALEL